MKAFVAAIFLITGVSDGADNPPHAGALKLELSTNPLTVTFTNTSKEPIRILKPLDGSEWCWIMPHYKLIATDERDQEMPLQSRCGLFGHPYSETKWPDDYLVIIPGGGSYKRSLRLNHDIKTAGVFSLRFQYIFTPTTDRTPGGPYPPDLWRGEASSNTIKMRLEPRP